MEGVKPLFVDDFDGDYDVVSRYRNGHLILYHNDPTPCPWVIYTPDGRYIRFKTENELWQYALKNKLFKKKKGKKNGNR